MATSSQATLPSSAETGRKPSKSVRLEEKAAAAALYDPHTEQTSKTGQEFLNKHHKLSSAGAAASLKYANPQDLPSFPTSGLKNGGSAAGAAASLGWANQKPFEHWKPDASASAAAAATLAKDYKMAPQWQPEASANGAKAALLAHRDTNKVEVWQPEVNSWGNSAATQAFKKHGAGNLSPQLDYGHTAIGRQGSLIAATGAMSKGRKRAGSSPLVITKQETYPDEHRAASNALSAATSAHRQKNRGDISPEGGASPYTNLGREMYTSHPPVAPEVEEQNRKDTLHASAVAMAQGMYKMQQKQFEAATQSESHRGAKAAHGRAASSSSISTDVEPMRFNNLQEAAHKLAQERLAKLHEEHTKNREQADYRDYYGHGKQPSRLSIRGRTRGRASSDGNLYEDKAQSDKIREQMSIFSQNVQQVDAKKQRQDRDALLAAAQRNVTAKLQGMDKKVFAETGQVGPSLLPEWELKAHAAAQAKSDTRMENHGKVNIGGGKFVDQADIDLIAQRNVQPVLDEINAKAEAERERQAALKADQETEARKTAEKKQRDRESKEINKKLKQQDKDEEKARKAEEKATKKEEERLAKERRKSLKSDAVAAVPEKTKPEEDEATAPSTVTATESPTETSATTNRGTALAERQEVERAPAPIRTSMEDGSSLRMRENADAANGDEVTPMSPSTSPGGGKVKNWLKSKFSKSSSSSSKNPKSPVADDEKSADKSFIGGTALTNATPNASTGDLSMRNVALAGKGPAAIPLPHEDESLAAAAAEETATTPAEDERIGRPARRTSQVSSVSSMGEEFQEARDNFDESHAPPQPQFPTEKAHSPARDSKFIESFD